MQDIDTDIASDTNIVPDTDKKATILLASGELDKALLAFEIAIGFASCGTPVDMWFVLFGINCIKKRKSRFAFSKWFPEKTAAKAGRIPETDTILQNVISGLNHDGSQNIPLSQLNYFGIGPRIFNRLLKKKNMATLDELIEYAQELGVNFRICQICIDAMAIDIEQDLVVDAEIFGVARYAVDARSSFYNAVF